MRVFALVLVTTLAGCQAASQETNSHAAHQGREASGTSAAAEYDASMARMHQAMGQASADADESFARMMLAHHAGAVDMARIELRHGRDPKLRKLAGQVGATQTPEIEQLRAWLQRHETKQKQ